MTKIMYNRSIAKPVINMLMFNQGRSQDFRKGGTLKITINSNYKTLSAPANVTGKAIYNDFCHAISGTVMLGTPKPRRRPSHYLAITLSLSAVCARRHRRLIHSTTTRFYQRGEYYVFVFLGRPKGHVPPVPPPPPGCAPGFNRSFQCVLRV